MGNLDFVQKDEIIIEKILSADTLQIFFAPLLHFQQYRYKAFSGFSQWIFHPRRHLRVNFTRNKPIRFKLSELFCQSGLGYSAKPPLQFTKPLNFVHGYIPDYQYFPFTAYYRLQPAHWFASGKLFLLIVFIFRHTKPFLFILL